MRFYLVDKVTRLCLGKYVEGVKCVSLTDDIFNEHFPGCPILPGSLILEGMAQMSGAFFEWCRKEQGCADRRAALTMVNRLKFRDMVVPGDKLLYRADVKCFYPDEYGAVTVKAIKEDGRVCAEGELIFTFLDIIDDRMKEISEALVKFASSGAVIEKD